MSPEDNIKNQNAEKMYFFFVFPPPTMVNVKTNQTFQVTTIKVIKLHLSLKIFRYNTTIGNGKYKNESKGELEWPNHLHWQVINSLCFPSQITDLKHCL